MVLHTKFTWLKLKLKSLNEKTGSQHNESGMVHDDLRNTEITVQQYNNNCCTVIEQI